ncbi:unnamed protein product [Microthlaspi erraticum]|uniref:Uncharacterized protein n=1 Tax=Microthlaspi erraticum TaxID=1685480 RepID=A0A6D2IBG0_9BRAS|nr:unnamed protein product [Microthlaspi erraticum]
MGGGTVEDEEESFWYPKFARSSSPIYFSDDVVSVDNISNLPNHADDLRRREKAYQEILQSQILLQEKLRNNSKLKLKLARRQILSYTPGSFADVNLGDYDIPKTTSIIVVGPKGAGKSSLVNRITRVIEDDEFAPARAQESYGTLSKGGTFFVQEYMIPRRGSASFCLYDTRGLSQMSCDSTSKIEQWITKGVHHGEPVIWTSDSSGLRDRLIRDGCAGGCEKRKVNSVIFVVNAVEILKSMETMENEVSYAHMIFTAFNCPVLSFKDDKPAVVMTHGDILLPEERARARVFLGELLGIPPDKQIFDIPDSRDAATELTVCNLLRHSLEHADKNLRFLPKRNFTISKVGGGIINKRMLLMLSTALTLFLALVIICFVNEYGAQNVADEAHHKLHEAPRIYNLTHEAQTKRTIGPPDIEGPSHASALNPESESEGEPSIDWRTTRRLWFHEEKVAEAKPSVDWRTTRRLWYVE